jgi:hypothetical protein
MGISEIINEIKALNLLFERTDNYVNSLNDSAGIKIVYDLFSMDRIKNGTRQSVFIDFY